MSDSPRQAIVDIGSNSIRLVVFGGPPRAPAMLFNEKVMAGLGRGVVAGGKLDPASVALALKGLARFAALLRLMQPVKVRVVATAAVRDAGDGAKFIKAVRALGLPAELLAGDDEAVASGYGVIAGIPEARGLVADMGGGSLELVRVGDGAVLERISLPLGVINVGAVRAEGRGSLRRALHKAAKSLDWLGAVGGQPLYLVGGGWRALARVHMHRTGWPLPVLGQYRFSAEDTRWLKADARELGPVRLAALPGVSAARAAQLADASALLSALVTQVLPSEIVISAFGLREGLLYQQLGPVVRAHDPLVEGVRHAVGGQLQVAAYPEALLSWSDGAFPGEPPALRRLRHCACLIAGTGWASNPDFRAIAGEDMALHGNWTAVDAAGRAMMAQALHVGLGGNPDNPPPILAQLAPRDALAIARAWGFALRLAQRLAGGAPEALGKVPIQIAKDSALVLTVPREDIALIDAVVERRLARLALALDREARIES